MKFLITILLLASASVASAQTTKAEASAEILRRLKASRPPITAAVPTRPAGLRRVVIIHQTAPAPVAPAPIKRRLDGTRLSNPPLVYGFTPNDWQWWYQWELHREEDR